MRVLGLEVVAETPYEKLRWFNGAMAAVHFAQGLLMLLLSTDYSLPVTASFVEFDPQAGRLVPVRETLFDLPMGPAVAAFLFMSALAHTALVLPGIFGWYVRNLRHHINRARWIEYSFSASWMIVIIAMLVGIYDVVSLLLIFAVNAAMILFGWMMELYNQDRERVRWTPFWFGAVMGAAPWAAIAVYLVGAGGAEGDVPNFVYGIFVSIFIFFNVFAVNMALQYRKVGPWRDYLFGEAGYIVLSLTAKSALAWQVWAGTLRDV